MVTIEGVRRLSASPKYDFYHCVGCEEARMGKYYPEIDISGYEGDEFVYIVGPGVIRYCAGCRVSWTTDLGGWIW